VGVAPNMFLANIASDLKKPDALVVVDPAQVQAFLDPLPVGRLWGVGRVTGQTLERLGLRTIGQVRQMSPEILHQHFGKSGEHFWQLAHGIDERRVVADREAKSVSHETTFAVDMDDREVLRAWLLELSEQVGWRLRRCHLQGRTIQIKIRFANFHTIVRSKTLSNATNATADLRRTAVELFDHCLATPHQRIRLLGVGVSGFESSRQVQKTLFDDNENEHENRQQLDQAMDRIRARFGHSALHRASGLLHEAEHQPAPRTTKRKPNSGHG
jgi:DNA polymerase-4